MTGREALLLTGVVVASALGQILLKRAAPTWDTRRGPCVFIRSVVFSTAPFALLLVLGAPFLYWKALETISLPAAHGAMALTGVLVLIGGVFWLKESPSPRVILGALLVVVGVALWGFT